MNGAELLVEALKREHVTHIFGYAGATICAIAEALKAAPELAYTLVRTEQNAGHMASGYARMSGEVGVCIVTSGPGATNLITGIATAYMDSIPMVAITGQVPSYLLGRDIFQEVDITGAVAPFSKHSYLVKNARDLPRVVKEAFYLASTGRPGPVLIDVPSDVQKQEVESPQWPEAVSIRGYRPSVQGNGMQIRRAWETIARSRRPVLCAGGGIFLAGAEAALEEFATRNSIPVVTTMMGLSLLPTDHPLNIGMVGSPAANRALAQADLLIFAGARVADRAICEPDQFRSRIPIIHMDVDPAEIGKNVQATIPIVGDVRHILRQLLEQGVCQPEEGWLSGLQALRRADLDHAPRERGGGVTPGRFLRLLGERLPADTAVCADVGQNLIWTCRYLPMQEGTRFLTSGGLGTMGYSLPAAVGVKAAQPERNTVVICGDGSFQMSFPELATIRAEQMNIKIIVFQNQVLGLVRQYQTQQPYTGPYGVDLDGSPDFQTIAAAYGMDSYCLGSDEKAEAVLDAFLSNAGSSLLIVRVHPECSTND